MAKEIITHSEQETFDWAWALGEGARKGDVFALYGGLGTGKTIIAKGLAKGIGIDEEITSPTFLLLEIYNGATEFYHFDLYRIGKPEELDALNFDDYWEGNGVSVIEWAENAGDRIPKKAVKIKLEWLGDNKRRIVIEYPDI